MLADTALRLAVINLLNPADQLSATTPVYPTIAGAKVYDSRLDPDDAYSGDETETGPVIVVYTEETHTTQRTEGEYIPHKHKVQLTVMASFYVRAQATLAGPNGEEDVWVDEVSEITDAKQELLLDLLAAQIHRRLTMVDSDPATELYAPLILGIESVVSTPLRDPSRTSRYATRTMQYICEIPDDKWTDDPAATGLAALPHPLSDVADALPVGSSARDNCEKIAAQMRAPTVPVPLAGIATHFNPDNTVPARDATTGEITAQMRADATTT